MGNITTPENAEKSAITEAEKAAQNIREFSGMIKNNETAINAMKAEGESMRKELEGVKRELTALQQSGIAPVADSVDVAKMSAGMQFVKSAGFAEFKKSIPGSRDACYRYQVKAAAPETTQADNTASHGSFAPPVNIGVVTDPRAVINIRPLFGTYNVEGSSYEFVRYGYRTTLTATGPAFTAEGNAKPEANYGGPIIAGTVKTLPVWTKLTEQMIADNANLVQVINDDLPYQLDKVIDYQILRGDGTGVNLKGLNQSGNYVDYLDGVVWGANDTEIDLVLTVKGKMEAAGIRNLILLLNSEDWTKVLKSKNVNKDYLIPGIVDIPTQRIWGVPVVLNENVESGKFYMGNFGEAGKIIERSGLQIEMARSGDDFERNLMTLRVERRLDFAVLQPKAVCYGNFSVS